MSIDLERARPSAKSLLLAAALAFLITGCVGTARATTLPESITQERPNAVVTTSCFSISAAYRNFPNAPNNTVTQALDINKVKMPSFTFTFNGPSATTVIPVSLPLGRNTVDLISHWKTNGVKGGFDVLATLKCQTYMTGRAFGLSAEALGINVPPTPDTGEVLTPGPSTTAPPCVNVNTAVISAEALCPSVVTTVGPPKSAATTTIAQLGITGLAPVPAISATVIKPESTSTCVGSSGRTTFASLTIGLATLINYEPPPNTTIELPLELGKIVLNEQLPVAGADHGLTVNAIHITVPSLGINVIVASATSDIHRCS